MTDHAIHGANWPVIASATLPNGDVVEMRSKTFGRGKTRITSWKFFRNGENIGYASTLSDADENWARVQAGAVRDDHTGRWITRG